MVRYPRNPTRLLDFHGGRPCLTIFGICKDNSAGSEKERAALGARLGFPVQFVYDSREH